ncbi:hypothetical protein D5H78_13735 [Vallicoccus soli]|uniref:Uncharacterized protein n=1 Tax=Vallicoccus soli TaxID=2339232 RepID=A0A3A3Z084_9ACTN|nr:hypothetical protein D5H78_13735 [Vallicoccus soli]
MLGLVLAAAALTAYLLWWGHGSWHPEPWERAVPVAEDRLRVEWIGGPCDLEWDAAVDEGPQQVVVTVRSRVQRGACDDLGLPRSLEVPLASPLGGREVVDGAAHG